MANEPRTTPVVDFPFTPKDEQMAGVLRRCLGKITPMVVIPLFHSWTSTNVGSPGSGAVYLGSGCMEINFADMGVDEFRLTGFGNSTDATTVIDFANSSTGNTLACRVTGLSSSADWFAGPWTRFLPPNTDDHWGARTTIPSAKTLSLFTLVLQCRSLNFQG